MFVELRKSIWRDRKGSGVFISDHFVLKISLAYLPYESRYNYRKKIVPPLHDERALITANFDSRSVRIQ